MNRLEVGWYDLRHLIKDNPKIVEEYLNYSMMLLAGDLEMPLRDYHLRI